MSWRRSAWLVLVPLLAVVDTSAGEIVADRVATALRARRFLELVQQTTGTPALSIAVAVDGKIVWSDAVGLADLENGAPVTVATRFRVGSVSKLLTVAVLARLAQSGLIDLDAPVGRYVADLPDELSAVTPRQLAGHLGGIRHYDGTDEFFNTSSYGSPTEALAIVRDDAVTQPPGEYLYSSWGFVLLGAAIEGAAGKNFRFVVQEQVLDPLDMSSTMASDPRSIVPSRARPYDWSKDRLINSRPIDLSDRWPSCG